MPNPNGAKGTAFESSLVPLLNMYFPGTIRRGKHGTKDLGDFYMPGNTRFILEAKNEKRMDLSGWLREAKVEAENYLVPCGVVVHKRRGITDPEQQYVTLTLGDFLYLTGNSE